MFKMEIRTGNAAFHDPATGEPDFYYEGDELSRILKKVAAEIRGGSISGNVYDYNGNKVGSWTR